MRDKIQAALIACLYFLLITSTQGCATSRGTKAKARINPNVLSDSQVEIRYTLGHSRYRYLAVSDENEIKASSYVNDQLLEARVVDRERYESFVRMTEDVLINSPGSGKSLDECKNPFQITLQLKGEISVTAGCRRDDKGGLVGDLVREGEMLLYSRQPKNQ